MKIKIKPKKIFKATGKVLYKGVKIAGEGCAKCFGETAGNKIAFDIFYKKKFKF